MCDLLKKQPMKLSAGTMEIIPLLKSIFCSHHTGPLSAFYVHGRVQEKHIDLFAPPIIRFIFWSFLFPQIFITKFGQRKYSCNLFTITYSKTTIMWCMGPSTVNCKKENKSNTCDDKLQIGETITSTAFKNWLVEET